MNQRPIDPAKSESAPLPRDAQKRVWVERVHPNIDNGKWPAKGIVGDLFVVEADLVSDGNDIVTGALLYRSGDTKAWAKTPFVLIENDRFRARFTLSDLGCWQYTIEAWVDEFGTWQRGLKKKIDAGQDIEMDLAIGAEIVSRIAKRAFGNDRPELKAVAQTLQDQQATIASRVRLSLEPRLLELAAVYPDRKQVTRDGPVLEVFADRAKARFSTWYEMFPRSTRGDGTHGTFQDMEKRLPYVASMGFDVLYLPPIHPIGTRHRKGKNNALVAQDGEPGSPWAIGSPDGGHKAIHPELGTLSDFRKLLLKANEHDLEIALDIALQVSPDHPYVTKYPEWFKQRPDGTIQYAENPPKKYQDIYPFDFSCRDQQALWQEIHGIFVFWIEQGVRIFRVDNPHTKPLAFWAWCLGDLKKKYPDVLFLAEAFTRPKLMYALAKAGFSQSYTYFTWRETGEEIRAYLEELTKTGITDFFRPNFWPNTPDILPEHLQVGGRPAFIARLVLASTLSSNYGIYGPAFELMEHVARPGSEEYIDNEKYEIKQWNIHSPDSLAPVITRLNQARRDYPALQRNDNLCFHPTDNNQLLCFSKQTDDKKCRVLVVVNLDFHRTQSGWVTLNLTPLGLGPNDRFQVHDLLSDTRYLWQGDRNYVALNPQIMPAHVFVIRSFVRRENDFDYYA